MMVFDISQRYSHGHPIKGRQSERIYLQEVYSETELTLLLAANKHHFDSFRLSDEVQNIRLSGDNRGLVGVARDYQC